MEQRNVTDDIADALNGLKECESASEIVTLVKQIIALYWLESFVFVSMRRGDATRESYRYLIGCDPAWCQIYRARNWYNNDPFMEHALRDSAMVLGSAISTGSPAQQEILQTAAQFGYRSGMVVPAHGPPNSRSRVLYLGSPLPPENVERQLWTSRFVMRQLAFELYEWWQVKIRRQAIANNKLDDTDVELLQCKRSGLTTRQISVSLGYTKSKVDARLRRIYDKLQVSNKNEAIARATQLDILPG